MYDRFFFSLDFPGDLIVVTHVRLAGWVYLQAADVTDRLKQVHPLLTPRVLRTFNLSYALESALAMHPPNSAVPKSLAEKLLIFNDAMRSASIQTHLLSLAPVGARHEVQFGTAKLNYVDPRIVVEWSRAHNVPLNKLYPRLMIERFEWVRSIIFSMVEKAFCYSTVLTQKKP
jgi:hypothetical protein